MKNIQFSQVVHDIVSIFIPGAYFCGATIYFLSQINPDFIRDLISIKNEISILGSFTVSLIFIVVAYLAGTLIYYFSGPVKLLSSWFYKGKKDSGPLDDKINVELVDKFNKYLGNSGNLEKNTNSISYYGYGESFIINNTTNDYLQVTLSKYRFTKNLLVIQIVVFFYLIVLAINTYKTAPTTNWIITSFLYAGFTIWTALGCKQFIGSKKNNLKKSKNNDAFRNSYFLSHLYPIPLLLLRFHEVNYIYIILLIICYNSIWFLCLQYLNLYAISSKEISRIMMFNEKKLFKNL